MFDAATYTQRRARLADAPASTLSLMFLLVLMAIFIVNDIVNPLQLPK